MWYLRSVLMKGGLYEEQSVAESRKTELSVKSFRPTANQFVN